MSSEPTLTENSTKNASKSMKRLQKEFQKKKEQFYIKKRGLFRKAEQVGRHCNSDIFIVVYNNDTQNMFSFQSDPKFNLEKISTLVLKDVQQGALYRNKKFVDEDFDKVKRNIKELRATDKQADARPKVAKRPVKCRENTVYNNDTFPQQKFAESAEELSMAMINPAGQQIEQGQNPTQQNFQTGASSQQCIQGGTDRYHSPKPAPQRSGSRCATASHQFGGEQIQQNNDQSPHIGYFPSQNPINANSPAAVHHQNQTMGMYTPEAQTQHTSASDFIAPTPYGRQAYATTARSPAPMNFAEENVFQQPIHALSQPQYHPQDFGQYKSNMHYPQQLYQGHPPLNRFSANPLDAVSNQQYDHPTEQPNVSHFHQNERTDGPAGASREPTEYCGEKNADRMLDERQIRQPVNCDDIFMSNDRDDIRSHSRSIGRQYPNRACPIGAESMNHNSDRELQKQLTFGVEASSQADIHQANASQCHSSFKNLTPQAIVLENMPKVNEDHPVCLSPATPIDIAKDILRTPTSFPQTFMPQVKNGRTTNDFNLGIKADQATKASPTKRNISEASKVGQPQRTAQCEATAKKERDQQSSTDRNSINTPLSTPQFDKEAAANDKAAIDDKNMMYQAITQQYNYNININCDQANKERSGASQGAQQFEFLNTDIGLKDGAPASPRKMLEKQSLMQRKEQKPFQRPCVSPVSPGAKSLGSRDNNRGHRESASGQKNINMTQAI